MTPTFRFRRPRIRWLAPALALALAACGTAGQYRDAERLFEAGDYVRATDEYRRVAEAKPDNVRYRQTYLTKRREALDVLFRRAEGARASGNLAEAEALYQAALQVEPGNALALEWLRRLGDMRRHAGLLVKIDELIAAGQLDPAEAMLRTVLAENPDNLRAQNSKERLRAARDAERAQAAVAALDAGFTKPVTLEFRDVPVRVAFDVLSKASGINFVYDQEVRPDLKVSVFLRKTPLDEAVRLIGMSTQLETRVLNANTMLVYPNTPAKVADYRELSVRSFYLQNADAKKVAETLKTLLKTEGIVVDEKLNLLVMRDSPQAIALAEKLIALQDIGEPEVMLDVDILEIKRSKLLDLGISLPTEVGLTAATAGINTPGLTLESLRHLGADDIQVSLPSASVRLRDERSDARILANPRIRVKSREKASILIGDKVPVITTTQTSTGFVSDSINYVDVGLKLEVEPSVYAGDEVAIKINLEVSNLVREIESQSGTLAYQIGTRNAQTVLRLRDGETQVLAGLINKEDRRIGSGWPGLSRFPVLDRIFGSTKNDHQDTEIVLSITPRLVRGIRRADIEDLEFPSGTATNLGGSAMRAGDDEVAPAEGAPAAADAGGAEPTALPEANAAPAQPLPSQANPPALAPAPVAAGGDAPGVLLDWSVPADVRVGEQFTAVLNVSALRPLEQLPLLIGFDPQLLQVVSVEEGSFMAQGGGRSSLTKQVNLSDGKVTATVVREGSAVTGQGTLLQVTFKALAASDGAAIRLLSATPGPESAGPARVGDATVRIR